MKITDSAASGYENHRDKEHQGIFPLRGKVKNALTTPAKEFFENAEVAGMFSIFGYTNFSSKFDPDKFKPSKVIIATDADADGKHIQSLLLIMFLKYLGFAVDRGLIYVANPPLYGLQVGKDKYKFFSDNIEYVDYVRNIFCKDNVIANDKKKVYTKNEIVKILYNNMDYVKLITHVATLFAIDIEFLEFLLYNRDLGFAKFKATVEKAYPYTKVTKENGTIMIHGLVGSLYQTVFFNDRLLFECKPVIDLIERSSKYYYINGNRSTLYQLMKAFNECEPSGITRYKGLGKDLAPYYSNIA